jgi:uncharacterized protein YjdB
VGGFLGHWGGGGGAVRDCYWDTQTSGQAASAGGGVAGRTTEQMQRQATFLGWDFVNVWGIREGRSYPYLRSLAPPELTGISITPKTVTVVVGATKQFVAAPIPTDAILEEVTWSVYVIEVLGGAADSGAPGTIDAATGLFTAIAPGTVTVRATSATDPTVYGTAEVTIVAGYTLTMVVVGEGSTVPGEGEHIYVADTVVNITAAPAAGKWFSHWDGDVADPTAPTTTVTMDAAKTVTAHFTATAIRVTGVTVTPETVTMSIYAARQLTATVLPANATNKDVTWTSSNEAIAAVSSTGLVTAVSAGTATITVTTADDNKTDTSVITVIVPGLTGITVAPETATVAVGATQQFAAVPTPADAPLGEVTWSVDEAMGDAQVVASRMLQVGQPAPPAAPQGLTVERTQTAFYLKWTPSSDTNIAEYIIEKKDLVTDFAQIGRIAAAEFAQDPRFSTTVYKHPGWTSDFTVRLYTFRVRAVDGAGNLSGWSEELEYFVFNSGNIAGVSNNPPNPTTFALANDFTLTYLNNYHWNFGRGAQPGTITLRHADGTEYGPWQTAGDYGMHRVPNAQWYVMPYVNIKAGTYTIIDSDPSTWAHNLGSKNRGMTWAEGYRIVGTDDPSGMPDIYPPGLPEGYAATEMTLHGTWSADEQLQVRVMIPGLPGQPPTLEAGVTISEITVGENRITFILPVGLPAGVYVLEVLRGAANQGALGTINATTGLFTALAPGTVTVRATSATDPALYDTAEVTIVAGHLLTMAVVGEGNIAPAEGEHIYAANTVVNITAAPAAGWEFSYWVGDVADPTALTTTVTMDAAKTVTAHFTIIQPPALPEEPPAQPEPPVPVYGDSDGDGQVTNVDATMVLRAAVRLMDLNERVAAADVNGDGRITAADATLILRRAAGLIDSFPVEHAD